MLFEHWELKFLIALVTLLIKEKEWENGRNQFAFGELMEANFL